MNVYDFDGTIYKKDSSVELYKYIIKKKPYVLCISLLHQICAIMKYKLKMISKEQMKEAYFTFLKHIRVEDYIDDFVENEIANINAWYFRQHRKDDVIISASPDFLIKEFADRLKVQVVIASQVDIRSGKFYSRNCYGEEKVRRFCLLFSNEEIDEFYSDSISDLPMAKIAKVPYIVIKNIPQRWLIKQE